MDPLLELLQENAKLSDREMADQMKLSPEEVRRRIEDWEKDGTILGYQAVLDHEKTGNSGVAAEIDVKITPERGGGFDGLARRIAQFGQVRSCYLMSGGYDLAVEVEGRDLREVAQFVTEKLATLEGVLSTTTHFRLKVYKEKGLMAHGESETERLAVAP